MDRQIVFKRTAKVLAGVTTMYLAAYTVFAAASLYLELRSYANIHGVDMSQIHSGLITFSIAIAAGSLIFSVVYSLRVSTENIIKKTLIRTLLIFYTIITGILSYLMSAYEYGYLLFLILIGLGSAIFICQILSIIPKGYMSKVIFKIENMRNGE